jgi:ribonucleoside-diphosphate reductase alpha chain
LQYDLWKEQPREKANDLDWAGLKERIMTYGLMNGLLIAQLHTATTASILGNSECTEPLMSNIFTRRVLTGEYLLVDKQLIADLEALGLWNDVMRQKVMQHNGSVQHIDEIPLHIKEIYKTSFEVSQNRLVDMAADRGPFICQSQSLNLFLPQVKVQYMSSLVNRAWKNGLKQQSTIATAEHQLILLSSRVIHPSINKKRRKIKHALHVHANERL